MKYKISLLAAILWFGAILYTVGGQRDAQWKKVDEAINKGLPKTAIEALDPIIVEAMKDGAYGEAAKAMCRKIVLEGNIQGNKPEEKITRLEAEIEKAPKEIVPILNTVLANWYWHYFQNNRWRFMQRTATAVAPGKDFTTWDLTRLFAEIDKKYQSALSAADMLKTIPVASYNDLINKGNMPDTYRPTLYDFITQEALSFYTSGEQAAAKAQDAFEVSADDPIFDNPRKFLLWKPDTTDTDSPVLRAIHLYQDLMRFHIGDKDQTAFMDVDLARFVYGKNIAFGEEKNSKFKKALTAAADEWSNHEIYSMALYHLARTLHDEGTLVEARETALRGEKAFPDSPGGRLCHNLIADIESKSVTISTEFVWNDCRPKIDVRYRNVAEVYFRAVSWDWNYFLNRKHGRPEYLDEDGRKKLLAKKSELEWSAKLPATSDYKERLEQIPAPQGLKPGYYFIIASHDPAFRDSNNQVTFTDVWVSDLSIVIRTRDGNIEGFVLESKSGEPVSGAEVEGWYLTNEGDRVRTAVPNTDENGFFSFKPQQHRGYFIRVRHNGQEVASVREYSSYHHGREHRNSQTIFFTDRAIYRPGQTIQYKGICVHVDQERNDYHLLSGQRVTVEFRDSNNKEIARQEHQCNDYGSFSGSFTAPRDRLMGSMTIRSQGPAGSTRVQVEEYKRPKFQVTLDAPKTAPRLNDKVSLQGKATAYTGAAVDGAQVKYRIVREIRWPDWFYWCYWYRPRSLTSQEIAHGVVNTGVDGSFKIEFTAKPDLTVSEKDEPSFSYHVNADVTDTAGETRSALRIVNVGYSALKAGMSVEEWQTNEKPVEIKLSTTTLDGEGQAAEGKVKICHLKEPEKVERAKLTQWHNYYHEDRSSQVPDKSDPNSWELGDVAVERKFNSDTNGQVVIEFKLDAGLYRAVLETQDRFGKKVTALLPIRIIKPDATRLSLKIPHMLAAPAWSIEPGKNFLALWGTGYDSGRALVEIEHRNKIVKRYWTRLGETQASIRHEVDENLRGGFVLHVTQVRENRAYLEKRNIDVPWNNKNLELKWEHFVSKLQPAQKETWTAVITGPDAQKSVAEMVAALYDQSLDAFMTHHWMPRFMFFYRDYSSAHSDFCNVLKPFQHLFGSWVNHYVGVDSSYRMFPDDLTENYYGYAFASGGGKGFGRHVMRKSAMIAADGMEMANAVMPQAAVAAAPMEAEVKSEVSKSKKQDMSGRGMAEGIGGAGEPESKTDLGKITARKNLNETAFFFPQLVSDSNGVVRMTFTMPEALTQWRFMGFAHDKDMRSGFIQGDAVTSKDLMVQPNPPRFLREGDVLEFTVKVSNQSDTGQKGQVRLVFCDARTDESVDKKLGNETPDIDFEIPAKESRSYSWKIKVPDGGGFLTYKAVGSTGKVSDGEEGFLPVLSRRIFVTESLPLPIRGPLTKKFEFKKLLESGKSDTLRHQNLVVQMVSNPSWYAIMALPFLMEFPHECSEQTFNRLYANALARFIANSDPKIRRIFDQWKGTPTLDSPLEKNQDLKSVMIEETPWLRQAQSESQARKNVGVLFDENRMENEVSRCFRKLAEMQLHDGSWPWFPGGYGNDYITLYITTGFGRMRHLGINIDMNPAVRSLARLDNWIDNIYREILRHGHKDTNNLSETIALYLYGRSFFLKDRPVQGNAREAVDYFLGQAKTYWLKLANRQSQGHLAIALMRFGDEVTPLDIMKSIKERSVTDEELGMFWRETELSWWWYRAPIETQALMIEAFSEVVKDEKAVEDCKVWLLKQKQTQDWKTTKATADAVYGLLLRGVNNLASDALVEVSLGGQEIKPEKVEAGTGFYEKKFTASEIKPVMGEVTVKKIDEGVAWGSLHWQYLEDMTKVTPYEGTPLKLKKTLYTRVSTKKGQMLEPVKRVVNVGDELVVRIELRTDRDMEYVHMKDQRGSGLEPVNVISRYKYQDGLAYYESTRDTASHFFIDYLPKGVYVFEYATRVVHRGSYQSGITEIQCMYAPEFNSHSESLSIDVQ
ncbi:MAG: alpha-2-macroglobulin family protein [Kiritimatiellae bacterium]|nr:alpha-2-macroglobulin family protein [Kiritimatiellia bacterium]MDD5520901.1 alpha-2-macroglobulin family protein [Kiritimatiellia bacterium]